MTSLRGLRAEDWGTSSGLVARARQGSGRWAAGLSSSANGLRKVSERVCAKQKEKMKLRIHPSHSTERSPRNPTSASTGAVKLPLLMDNKLEISIIKSD